MYLTVMAPHGGNVFEICRNYGWALDEVVDLSASINPFGPPESLKHYLMDNFSNIIHYPDIHNVELIQALETFHGLPESLFAVGNGSTELIYWLPFALKLNRVAVILPTFGEYTRALENCGITIRKLITSWPSGFRPTVEQIDALVHATQPQAVIMTNPGSPSGALIDANVIDYIQWSLKRHLMYWIIDEVFIDFCEEHSLKKLVRDESRLIIIRSLTKFFAIPGLRIGYLIADTDVIEKIKRYVPPWSVNVFAQYAGVYCLRERDFMEKTVGFFHSEGMRVKNRLASISSIDYVPFAANYVLIKLGEILPINSTTIQQCMLKEHRILIRDCKNFEGLSDRYIRIALSLPEINDLWLNALEKGLRASSEG